MNYHKITPVDSANGVGCRTVLWVSGCEHHCHGCHNDVTWDYESGKPFEDADLKTLCDCLAPDWIDGLTLSGGDPMAPGNRLYVTGIVYYIKKLMPRKTIWLYTGYPWEAIADDPMLKFVDVVVDGPYVESERDISLRFRGSRNQRIIDAQKTLAAGNVVLWEDDPLLAHKLVRRDGRTNNREGSLCGD